MLTHLTCLPYPQSDSRQLFMPRICLTCSYTSGAEDVRNFSSLSDLPPFSSLSDPLIPSSSPQPHSTWLLQLTTQTKEAARETYKQKACRSPGLNYALRYCRKLSATYGFKYSKYVSTSTHSETSYLRGVEFKSSGAGSAEEPSLLAARLQYCHACTYACLGIKKSFVLNDVAIWC